MPWGGLQCVILVFLSVIILTYLFSLKIKYGRRILRMHFLQMERESLANTTRITYSLQTAQLTHTKKRLRGVYSQTY